MATAQEGEIIAGPEIGFPTSMDAVVRGPGEYLAIGLDGVAVRVSTGGDLLGPPLRVFSVASDEHVDSVSAAWNGAIYVVAWGSSVSSEVQRQTRILAVRLDGAGGLLDAAPVQLAGTAATGPVIPLERALGTPVVVNGGGGFLVAWTNAYVNTKLADLLAVKLDSAGVPVGQPVVLVGELAAKYGFLGAASNGTAYVLGYPWAWSHGMPTVFSVYVTEGNGGLHADHETYAFQDGVGGPAAASDGSDFLLVWSRTGGVPYVDPGAGPEASSAGIVAASVSGAGVRGAPGRVSSNGGHPALAFDGASYLALWFVPADATTATAFARRIDRQGVPVGPGPQALSFTTPLVPLARRPLLASGGKGSSLLVYGSSGRLILTDRTPPTVKVPKDIAVFATRASGRIVTFEATALDDYSGPLAASCAPASGSEFPPGATRVSCSARDEAGNVGTGTFVVRVTFSWSGILPPVRSDGSSVFHVGRTIPLKFRLVGESARIPDVTAKLTVREVSHAVHGGVEGPLSPAAAHAGNTFRYDSSADQYVFDLKTAHMPPGTYEARIDMGDGVDRSVRFSLRR